MKPKTIRPMIRVVMIVALVLALAALGLGTASAKVWTDQADYTPGSVVTISGDNSNNAGYLAGETVHVAVQGPNSTNYSCDAIADSSGAWSCQITLLPDVTAVGDYTYTATGQTSGVSESGIFSDAPTSVHANSATGPSTLPEGTAFTLYVIGTGFNSTAAVTWTPPGGVARTLTRLSQTSTQLTATVLSTDLPNEGTAGVRVTQTGGTGAGGPINFTITEADSLTLTPVNVQATSTGAPGCCNTGTTFTGKVATLTDTYDNQNPSEFTVSINWGDGSTATTGTATRTGTGIYDITGSHMYTALGFQTSVRLVTTTPASGSYTLPIANNGTTNFASSGSITVFTYSGYQTITYTGKTTGTNTTTFTGCTGAYNATIPAGATVFQSYKPISVTVTDPSPGTATVTGTSPLTVSDGVGYTSNTGPFSTTEGATYGVGSSFPSGSVSVSTLAGFSYEMLITSGSQSAWASTYTLGVNTYVWIGNVVAGSITFPEEGSASYTETLYNATGTPVAQGSGTVTVNDAGLSYFSAINTYPAFAGSPTGNIQVGKFLDANPGDNHGDFTITIHWGDGNTDIVPAVYSGPNGSQATYTVSGNHTYANVGTYTVTYDVLDDGGSSLTGISTATVKVTTTSTVVTSAQNPSTYGQSVTFTATVTNNGSTVAPSGSVEFFDGSTDLGASTLGTSSGNQTPWTFTTSTLSAGSHTIQAVFSDGTTFGGSQGTLAQMVNPAATSTAVTSSLNPSFKGQPVKFTATVTNNGSTVAPSGSVEFFDGTTDLGAGALGTSSGNQTPWTFTTSTLGVGTHNIKAVFNGSANFSGSQGTLMQTVNVDTTPPTVVVSAMGTDGSGKVYVDLTVQDTQSGLAVITPLVCNNCTLSIPPFTTGTTAPVIVRATKTNNALGAQVGVKATDVAGNVTNFDPVLTLLRIAKGTTVKQSFGQIPPIEHFATIQNGKVGLQSVTILVNGKTFTVSGLKANELRSVNVGSAMQKGNNKITLTGSGKLGATALIMVGPNALGNSKLPAQFWQTWPQYPDVNAIWGNLVE